MNVLYYTNRGRKRTSNNDALAIHDDIRSNESFMEVKKRFIEGNDEMCAYSGAGSGSLFVVANSFVSSPLPSSMMIRSFVNAIPELRDIHSWNARIREDAIRLVIHRTMETAKNKIRDSIPDPFAEFVAFAGIFMKNDHVYIFQYGDCEVYRVKDFIMKKVAPDCDAEDVEQRLWWNKQSFLDRALLRDHPSSLRSRLNHVKKSTLSFTSESFPFPGRMFLLCSGGIRTEVSRNDMERCFRESKTSYEAARELQARLIFSECPDNVSFILIKTGEEPKPYIPQRIILEQARANFRPPNPPILIS